MSDSDPVSENKAAELAVQAIMAAGKALEMEAGEEAASFFRHVVRTMGDRLQSELEWRSKAEAKILELASQPRTTINTTTVHWIKVDGTTVCKAFGMYVVDGDNDSAIQTFDVGDKFLGSCGDCGGNIHVAGPFEDSQQ